MYNQIMYKMLDFCNQISHESIDAMNSRFEVLSELSRCVMPQIEQMPLGFLYMFASYDRHKIHLLVKIRFEFGFLQSDWYCVSD